MIVVGEESIEEINQDGFVGFSAKDAFEAKISEETDIFILEVIRHDQVG